MRLPVALVDRSGTITSGGTAQTLAAGDRGRVFLLIQNTSDISMWVDFGVTAVAASPSIQIAAGTTLLFSPGSTFVVPSEAVSIIGATTGKTFTCKTV